MAFPLTEEQRRVVENRGGELLVSAAAGSGKTRVLVERLLQRVTEEGLNIDDFLVITYTRAAAAELRERVAQELTQRLAEQPGDRHLRRQTTLVYRAQISTIHSFCANLLRESGHMLGLDGDFRLCDEGEGKVIRTRVLEELLERKYTGLDPESEFAALVDTLAAGRDDRNLEEIVLDVFLRVQSHPDPERWLMEQKELWLLSDVKDAGETQWGKLLLEEACRQVEYSRQQLVTALDLCEADEILSANYAPSISASIHDCERFLEESRKGWDHAAACLPIAFPTAGRKRGAADTWEARQMKDLRSRVQKDLKKVEQALEGSSQQLIDDMKLAAPAVRGLMDLVIEFQQAYQQEKEKKDILDFSDLEHFAVRLLTGEGSEESSELARFWSSRFAEVMVDEYQDTNQVQNVIFTAISDNGKKLFQVGDVKQSIYRFRLADPTIFLGKYLRFPTWSEAEEGEPRSVVLSRNFRSRAQVLEGCNDLFRAVMSEEFGELDYTEDQALYPGASYPPCDRPVELALLDLSGYEGEEAGKPNKHLQEARWTASRIRSLLEEEFLVGPEGAQRLLEPSDVMILLRSPGTVLHHYIRALNEQGIGWSAEGSEDIFQTTEVNVALSLLRVVDNPRQDVPLISVLRSPVYGFSADRLSQLRGEAEGDFYLTLEQAAQNGADDCRAFLEELSQLRFGAGDKSCRQLIWHIYEQTNLLGLFGAMDGGETRQNNLLALYNIAGQLEGTGCTSLFQFLLRLDRLRELGSPLSGMGAGNGDGVSIMSIHRSKGLEKPVVFVCGLAKKFNREDMNRPVLFHPNMGVGPRGLDRERMVEYPTLARKAVQRKLEREMMAEELRLLYVAMTRAREKLILTMTLTDGVKVLERLKEDFSVPLNPMALEKQQSVGNWVLLHVLGRPECRGLRAIADLPDMEQGGLGSPWKVSVIDAAELTQPQEHYGRFADRECMVQGDMTSVREQLRWEYPNRAAADIPSKLTATQIKGRTADREIWEEAAGTQKKEEPLSIRRPQFIQQEKGLTPAERGTALHLAMQYLPLTDSDTPEKVAGHLERLAAGGYLTPLQAQAADPQTLSAFFSSELGREMARAVECRREFKFSVLLPACEYYDGAGKGEAVLMQGIIDAWFEKNGELTLVDFKSDRVSLASQKNRAEEYREQLQAYSRALEEMTGKPVCRKVLWFFATNSPVEL